MTPEEFDAALSPGFGRVPLVVATTLPLDPTRSAARLPVREWMSALAQGGYRKRPPHVFPVRDWLKVFGVDATRIPAQMVQFQGEINGAVCQLVLHSVGVHALPPRRDSSVPAAVRCSLPNPTAGCRINDVIDSRLSMLVAANEPATWLWPANLRQVLTTAARAVRILGAIVRVHFSDLLDRSGGAVPGAFAALPGVSIVLDFA